MCSAVATYLSPALLVYSMAYVLFLSMYFFSMPLHSPVRLERAANDACSHKPFLLYYLSHETLVSDVEM